MPRSHWLPWWESVVLLRKAGIVVLARLVDVPVLQVTLLGMVIVISGRFILRTGRISRFGINEQKRHLYCVYPCQSLHRSRSIKYPLAQRPMLH
jgi:hypothetical protein